MARKLTDKQQRFVEEYLIDLNATQAAIRAGYSPKTADSQAVQLLRKTQVQEAIAAGKQERSEKTAIDATYVLNRLVEIDQMDVLDILDDDGHMRPVSQWPKVWRTTLSGVDINRLKTIGEGDDAIESVLQKIKWPDKVKNLELIGKHVEVQAFKDQLGLSGGMKISHEDALSELE
ncbi:terminase small subunit [Marinobacterium sp. MBR-109]|jgi:phage terminase small subunit|uniref:terminase small subunit n=1 Tax=Marinobacterium sp. MBR-109 TaxID=3156462 RepID=UPI0033968D29